MNKITQDNFRPLLPAKIAAIVKMIAAEEKRSQKDALIEFYKSKTYKELEREESKYWWQSPLQLYRDFINNRV